MEAVDAIKTLFIEILFPIFEIGKGSESLKTSCQNRKRNMDPLVLNVLVLGKI